MGQLVADVVARIVRLVAQKGRYLAVLECALVCRLWRDEVAKAMREAPLRALRASFWAFHGTATVRFEMEPVWWTHLGPPPTWISWLPGRRFFMTASADEGTVWSVGNGQTPAIANQFKFFEDKEHRRTAIAGATGDVVVSSSSAWMTRRGRLEDMTREWELRLYSSRSGWRDATRLGSDREHRDMSTDMYGSEHAIDISPDGQKVVVAAVSGRIAASILTVTLLDRNLEPRGEKKVTLPRGAWVKPWMVAVLDARAEQLVVALGDSDGSHVSVFELTGGPCGDFRPEIEDITDKVFQNSPEPHHTARGVGEAPGMIASISRLSSGHFSWQLGSYPRPSSLELATDLYYTGYWRPWLQRFAVGCEKSGTAVAIESDTICMLGGDEYRLSAIGTLRSGRRQQTGERVRQFVSVDLSGNWLITTGLNGIRGYEMRPDYRKLEYLLLLNRTRGNI